MSKYAEHVSTKITPQTEPVPGKPMVPNSAGGFTFAVDDWQRLDRFLILGAEGGTYYVKERPLTQDNAKVVQRCALIDPKRTVDRIVEISEQGRAPKNDPAVFALALCAAQEPYTVTGGVKPDAPARHFAYAALPKVCRTGTHLFQFVAACDALRGWGTGLRKAVAAWYTDRDSESLAYQVTKYQQRNGWSHRDVLRLCHARTAAAQKQAVLRWCAAGNSMDARTVIRGKADAARTRVYEGISADLLPPSILAIEELKAATTAEQVVSLITKYGDKAPRELIPTQFLTEKSVWEALLIEMPMTAMIRNLGNMSKIGLITPLSDAERIVCARLRDVELLRRARIHPLNLLVALKTYTSGAGVKGSGTWIANQRVVDALQDAFYLSFQTVTPTGKRWAFGLDVSGSMGSPIAGLPITSCEAVTALSLVSARTEPYSFTGLFADRFEEAPFGNLTRLDDAMKYTRHRNFGSTDCSLLMGECLKRKIPVDVFCAMTDSETYAGGIHPFQALKQYRDATGIPAKLIVVATTATEFTIADPSDAGMLDVVGFDTSVPAVMSAFARE